MEVTLEGDSNSDIDIDKKLIEKLKSEGKDLVSEQSASTTSGCSSHLRTCVVCLFSFCLSVLYFSNQIRWWSCIIVSRDFFYNFGCDTVLKLRIYFCLYFIYKLKNCPCKCAKVSAWLLKSKRCYTVFSRICCIYTHIYILYIYISLLNAYVLNLASKVYPFHAIVRVNFLCITATTTPYVHSSSIRVEKLTSALYTNAIKLNIIWHYII